MSKTYCSCRCHALSGPCPEWPLCCASAHPQRDNRHRPARRSTAITAKGDVVDTDFDVRGCKRI